MTSLPDVVPQQVSAFRPSQTDHLPEPARRWLLHAIAPGTPLLTAAVLTQTGRVRVGLWQHVDAEWAVSTEGYDWTARTRLGPLRLSASDRYAHGVGRTRWSLGRLPLAWSSGEDVTRSAAGRLAGAQVHVPAALLLPTVRWESLDAARAVAHVHLRGWTHRVILTVAPDGRLERADVMRWASPGGGHPDLHRHTTLFDGPELTVAGFTVPTRARSGWWQCEDGCGTDEVLDVTTTSASYS